MRFATPGLDPGSTFLTSIPLQGDACRIKSGMTWKGASPPLASVKRWEVRLQSGELGQVPATDIGMVRVLALEALVVVLGRVEGAGLDLRRHRPRESVGRVELRQIGGGGAALRSVLREDRRTIARADVR